MEEKGLIKSEVEDYAKFDIIRYAQVWEDAKILIEALDIKNDDNILSIASAGENVLSMLVKNPNKIYAIDLSESQIICTKFKLACFKYLNYEECMKAIGVFECDNRIDIYEKIKDKLEDDVREYFSRNLSVIKKGIINCGKFEHYFSLFGKKVLPLIHSKKTRQELLTKKSEEQRKEFYDKKWNNTRWKMLFSIFFSRTVMGRLGRDKAFFRYVEGSVADHILDRTKYALTKLDTSENSYLHYIVNGHYENVLPIAYRKENFEVIKNNIQNVVVLKESVETFLNLENINDKITKYNLSDIFEYMSEEQMNNISKKIVNSSPSKSKIAYWNMLSPKRASKNNLSLKYLEEKSKELFLKDKAFFYSDFIIEEIK